MKENFSKKILREFGFLISFAFPILIGFILPALGGHPFRTWTLCIGIPAFILSIAKPNLLFYPYKAWMKIGYILGWLNSRIILGLLFYLVVLPISLIMRLLGHDPLRLKKNDQKSFKEIKVNNKIDLKKIF